VVTIVCTAQWSRGYFEFDPDTCTILVKRGVRVG
jgi:hypothetical protein